MYFIFILFLVYQYSKENNILLNIDGKNVDISIGIAINLEKFMPDLALSCTYIDFLQIPIKATLTQLPITKKLKVHFRIFTCEKHQGSLYIGSLPFKNYSLYVSKSRHSNHHLGLAYQMEKDSSIVHQSYNYGYISKMMFSLKIQEHNKGYLYLGGIPDEFNGYKRGFCNVERNYTTWGCKVKSVLFLGNEYISNDYVYLDFSWVSLKLTFNFMEYFKKTMNVNIREEKLDNVKYYALIFWIGDYKYTYENQIKQNANGKYTLIDVNLSDKDFILGKKFFYSYVFSFDYESNSLSIYGINGIEEAHTNKNNYWWFYWLININISILLIGILNIINCIIINVKEPII